MGRERERERARERESKAEGSKERKYLHLVLVPHCHSSHHATRYTDDVLPRDRRRELHNHTRTRTRTHPSNRERARETPVQCRPRSRGSPPGTAAAPTSSAPASQPACAAWSAATSLCARWTGHSLSHPVALALLPPLCASVPASLPRRTRYWHAAVCSMACSQRERQREREHRRPCRSYPSLSLSRCLSVGCQHRAAAPLSLGPAARGCLP